MLKLLRWLGLGVLGLVVLAAVGVGGVWFYAQSIIDHRYPLGHETVPGVTGAEAVARGEHVATILGCKGCHEANLQGHYWFQDPLEPPTFTANLTRVAQEMSDEDLARIVRRGVLPDGRGVNAMPSNGYGAVSDADMGDLIAFIRSKPVGGPDHPVAWLGLPNRWKLVTGKLELGGQMAQAAAAVAPVDLGPAHARGRYLARTVCAECHGADLKGHPEGPPGHNPPNLVIAGSYELADFRHFMKTGKAAGGRELPLMSEVARERFSHLPDEDVAALWGYLKARAETR